MPPIPSPLADEHRRLGARLVEFAGHLLPLAFGSALEETLAVRRRAGLFDVSHMAFIRVTGGERMAFLASLVTCDVAATAPGRCRYGLLLRDDGTAIDDVLAYHEPGALLLCVNAANRGRVMPWLLAHAAGRDVRVEDLASQVGMLALQGPAAPGIAGAATGVALESLRNYTFVRAELPGIGDALISRTGYTGEDGFEFVVARAALGLLWRRLLDPRHHPGGVAPTPAGLAARDTLRLEAGMPLYGHELDDDTTPVEAGLLFALRRSGGYVGAEAIARQLAEGPPRRLVGFVTSSRRIPRQGAPLLRSGQPIAAVASGAFSPTLERCIGTALLPAAIAREPAGLALDLRGHIESLQIVPLPFYRRTDARPPGRPQRSNEAASAATEREVT